MNEFYSHKPNTCTYSCREVNNNIQYIKFCTCVKKITIALTRRWDFHINNIYKFTKFF